MLPVGIIGCGVTLAFPVLTLLMLDRFPAARGAAASVQAAMNLGFSSLIAGLLSPRVSHSPLALALSAALLTAIGFVVWRWYRRITPDCTPQVISAAVEPASAPTPSGGGFRN